MTHKEKYNDTVTVDVIIPAYRPGREFGELLHRLEEQEYRPRRILVMNTESSTGTENGRNVRSLRFITWNRRILIMAEPEEGQQNFRMQIL